MKNILFIIPFLYLSACGIEVPQPIPRLNSPNGVVVYSVTNALGSAEAFQVTWCGLNPESGFSGYNIYYATNEAEAMAFRGTRILCKSFNPKQATLPIFPPFNTAKPFSFVIKQKYYPTSPDLFTNAQPYWFYIKAYNSVYNLESPPSQYFKVTFNDNILP